jgi:PAS domain S-box-containing protein
MNLIIAWRVAPHDYNLDHEKMEQPLAFFLGQSRKITMNKSLDIQEKEIQELQNRVNQLEKQLREAQANNCASCLLARLPAYNPNPILQVSSEGIILYHNVAAARLTGWKCEPNELLPMPLRLLVSQAWTENRPMEQDVLLDGKTYAVSVVPIAEEGCVNLYGGDITEHKKAETALAESESRQREISRLLELDQARLAAVLRHMPVGIWIVDGQGRLTGSNPEADRIWGGDTPLLNGIEDYRKYVCWRPEQREPLLPEEHPIVVALQTREFVPPHELNIRRFDRSEGAVLASAAPIKDSQGRLMGVVGVNVDITERKQAEQALHESEWRLRRAQEIAHLGSWELDLLNDRLTWSDEVYRIFGLEPQQFAATYEAFLEAVHPEDRRAVDAAYSGSIRADQSTYEIEHRVVRPSTGEVRFVHEKCEHFRDQDGRIVRSIGMVHDITEWKVAEAALEKKAVPDRPLADPIK